MTATRKSRLAGLLVDITPLRASRDFRLLWIGQAISFFGGMITMAALPYQLFHETGSSVAVPSRLVVGSRPGRCTRNSERPARR